MTDVQAKLVKDFDKLTSALGEVKNLFEAGGRSMSPQQRPWCAGLWSTQNAEEKDDPWCLGRLWSALVGFGRLWSALVGFPRFDETNSDSRRLGDLLAGAQGQKEDNGQGEEGEEGEEGDEKTKIFSLPLFASFRIISSSLLFS